MPLQPKYKVIGAFCYHIYSSITYRNLKLPSNITLQATTTGKNIISYTTTKKECVLCFCNNMCMNPRYGGNEIISIDGPYTSLLFLEKHISSTDSFGGRSVLKLFLCDEGVTITCEKPTYSDARDSNIYTVE